MKRFRIVIAIMLACCGFIEINLVVSNSTSTVAWTLYFVIIIGVLLGIGGYKIGNSPLETPKLSSGILLFILIANILYVVVVSQMPISEMLDILLFGLIFPMYCIEESTRFLLFDIRQKSEEEVTVS